MISACIVGKNNAPYIRNCFESVRDIVDEIIYPKDCPPEEMREKSKRKGRVVRTIEIDGRRIEKEVGFEV